MVPPVFSLSSLGALFAQIASTVFPRRAAVQNCSRSTIKAGASRELTTIPRPNRPRWPGYRLTQKGARRRPVRSGFKPALLDLGFAELDVLLHHRIVFLHHQLVGHGARILAGDVMETGTNRPNPSTLMSSPSTNASFTRTGALDRPAGLRQEYPL